MKTWLQGLLSGEEGNVVLQRPPSPTAIAAAEQLLGFSLPNDYLALLSGSNGMWVGDDGVYGIPPVDQMLDALRYRALLSDDWPANQRWLPIASDGCGNYYVLMCELSAHGRTPVGFIDSAESLGQVSAIVASAVPTFLFFFTQARVMTQTEASVWERIVGGENVAIGRWPEDDSYVYRVDPALRFLRERIG